MNSKVASLQCSNTSPPNAESPSTCILTSMFCPCVHGGGVEAREFEGLNESNSHINSPEQDSDKHLSCCANKGWLKSLGRGHSCSCSKMKMMFPKVFQKSRRSPSKSPLTSLRLSFPNNAQREISDWLSPAGQTNIPVGRNCTRRGARGRRGDRGEPAPSPPTWVSLQTRVKVPASVPDTGGTAVHAKR